MLSTGCRYPQALSPYQRGPSGGLKLSWILWHWPHNSRQLQAPTWAPLIWTQSLWVSTTSAQHAFHTRLKALSMSRNLPDAQSWDSQDLRSPTSSKGPFYGDGKMMIAESMSTPSPTPSLYSRHEYDFSSSIKVHMGFTVDFLLEGPDFPLNPYHHCNIPHMATKEA